MCDVAHPALFIETMARTLLYLLTLSLFSHGLSAYTMAGFVPQSDSINRRVLVAMQVAWSVEPSSDQWLELPSEFNSASFDPQEYYLFDVTVSDGVHVLMNVRPLDAAIGEVAALGAPVKVGRYYDDFQLDGILFGRLYKYVPWLGLHYQLRDPWWYQFELGWIYVEVVDSYSMWIWNPPLGWSYLSGDLYPWVWSFERGWVYVDVQQRNGFYFFSWNENQWSFVEI